MSASDALGQQFSDRVIDQHARLAHQVSDLPYAVRVGGSTSVGAGTHPAMNDIRKANRHVMGFSGLPRHLGAKHVEDAATKLRPMFPELADDLERHAINLRLLDR